jgi:hypothetical protein
MLRATLVINLGLCLLLAYKVYSIPVMSPEQVTEVRNAVSGELEEADRKSFSATLLDFAEKREAQSRALRRLVLQSIVGMLPFFVTSLVFVWRIGRFARVADLHEAAAGTGAYRGDIH